MQTIWHRYGADKAVFSEPLCLALNLIKDGRLLTRTLPCITVPTTLLAFHVTVSVTLNAETRCCSFLSRAHHVYAHSVQIIYQRHSQKNQVQEIRLFLGAVKRGKFNLFLFRPELSKGSRHTPFRVAKGHARLPASACTNAQGMGSNRAPTASSSSFFDNLTGRAMSSVPDLLQNLKCALPPRT